MSGQTDIPSSFSSEILSIALGQSHTCAISTRMLVCWGDNLYNQTTVPKDHRKSVRVSASLHTCSVNEQGRVGCWGRNNLGQTDVPEGVNE
mmetsp:Transcript_53353/g.44750  ORF Transcript_53353/g.44750 Transcript_53353/m.44750 type:complete len:91 (+) Transcript_53353:252-524(+)